MPVRAVGIGVVLGLALVGFVSALERPTVAAVTSTPAFAHFDLRLAI